MYAPERASEPRKAILSVVEYLCRKDLRAVYWRDCAGEREDRTFVGSFVKFWFWREPGNIMNSVCVFICTCTWYYVSHRHSLTFSLSFRHQFTVHSIYSQYYIFWLISVKRITFLVIGDLTAQVKCKKNKENAKRIILCFSLFKQ